MLSKVKNNHIKYFFLSIFAVILLSSGWYPYGYFPLTIFGFVPIFFLEHYIRNEQKNHKFWLFIYGFFTFLLWNITCIYWIWHASEGGAIAAFLINSLPMVLPLMLYSNLNSANNKHNGLFFIAAWVCLEWVQFYWDFSFPWMIVGNAFANWPNLVQWYEFTGVIGGSIYILLFSFFLFKFLLSYKTNNTFKNYRLLFNIIFFGVFTPVFLSYYVANNYKSKQTFFKGKTANLLVVQPNIDPYGEKFGSLSPMQQLSKMLSLVQTKITPQTQFIILPETALQGGLNENQIETEELIIALKSFLTQYPNVGVLTGADTYKIYNSGEKLPVTARKANNQELYYDAFNTALYITATDSVKIYHKNKLVPGVEKMPYPAVFKFLEKFAIGLGGTSGSLGSAGQSAVFKTSHNLSLAPIICYESAFAEFVSTYVDKGADILVIITNDGWWKDTPGYKQHLNFARLRAIETRKPIARCANTGTSAFINPFGDISQATPWWQTAVITDNLHYNTVETFYVKHKDYLAMLCFGIFILNIFNFYFKK